VIIFDDFTTAIKYVDFKFKVKSSAMKILHVKKQIANPEYVFNTMGKINFKPGEHKRHWISQYSKFKIPLPPLEVQIKIISEIKKYQNENNLLEEKIETNNKKIRKIIEGIWEGEK